MVIAILLNCAIKELIIAHLGRVAFLCILFISKNDILSWYLQACGTQIYPGLACDTRDKLQNLDWNKRLKGRGRLAQWVNTCFVILSPQQTVDWISQYTRFFHAGSFTFRLSFAVYFVLRHDSQSLKRRQNLATSTLDRRNETVVDKQSTEWKGT